MLVADADKQVKLYYKSADIRTGPWMPSDELAKMKSTGAMQKKVVA